MSVHHLRTISIRTGFLAQTKVAYRASEFAICENLVYPILKEVWMPYAEQMQLWCHTPLVCDKDLTGTPDYFGTPFHPGHRGDGEAVARGDGRPRRNDFTWGWAQCLAAMTAAQRLKFPPLVIHGITTMGRSWEFRQLQGDVFTCVSGSTGLMNLQWSKFFADSLHVRTVPAAIGCVCGGRVIKSCQRDSWPLAAWRQTASGLWKTIYFFGGGGGGGGDGGGGAPPGVALNDLIKVPSLTLKMRTSPL